MKSLVTAISVIILVAGWSILPMVAATSPHLMVVAKKRAAAGSAFPSTGLVAWWKMDEASGNAIDSGGGGYDHTDTGTVGSSASDGPGADSNVRTFDGSTQYFTRANTDVLDPMSGSFTVAVWAYADATIASNSIYALVTKKLNSTSEGWAMQVETNVGSTVVRLTGAQAVEDGAAANVSPTDNTAIKAGGVAPGEWFHLAMVFDHGTTLKFYGNGVEIDSVSAATVTGEVDTTTSTNLGALNTGNKWDGKLGRAGYWSRALGATEVSDLYNGGLFLDP